MAKGACNFIFKKIKKTRQNNRHCFCKSLLYYSYMPKRVNYPIDEILDILNKTKSWRAVDKHFNRGHNVIKKWCINNDIKIIKRHFYELQK